MLDDPTFLRAVQADPHDDAPLLIYADWLEERGDRRGELLRVWCQLNRTSHADEWFRRLLSRYRELWSAAEPGWVRQLGAIRPWVDGRLAEELARGYLRYVEGRGGDRRGVIEGQTAWLEEGWLVGYWMKAFRDQGRRVQYRWCLFVDKDCGRVFTVWTAGPRAFLERYKAGRDWEPVF